MKYGLLYYKETDNIGDDIQTYAAKRFLPHIDYYIDRESLNCFIPKEKEYVSMIMNAWYIHNKCAWPPSPYINPLLISMHFTNLETVDVGDKYLQGLGGEYLKKYGKIGARDLETKKRLENNGIDCYFSGCMTLTLNKFENVEKKNKIIIVDTSKEVEEKIKQSTDKEIETLTHWLDPSEVSKKDISERMKDVEILLNKYQEAHLVVTSRLHVALPCVAMGTPVILVHKENYEKDRLGTYIELVDSYVDTEFLNMDIKDILERPKANSEKYLEIRNNLIRICEEFIKDCENENKEVNTEDLPNIEEYYQNYVSKIEWYKGLYETAYNNSKNTVFSYEKKLNDILKEKKEIEEKYSNELQIALEQNEKLKEEKEKYQKELSEIYNSRAWKYVKNIRKILSNKGKE